MGPPGSKRKENALLLSEYFNEEVNLNLISIGDLLNKEISKKSALAKKLLLLAKTIATYQMTLLLIWCELKSRSSKKNRKVGSLKVSQGQE